MTLKKYSNYNDLGVIIIWLLTTAWTLFHYPVFYGILIHMPFLLLYLSLPSIKINLLKKILILIELIWIIFLFFAWFYLLKYEFVEQILPLVLLFINIVLRIKTFIELFVIKHPVLLSFMISVFISIFIYWYGTTEYLRIGF